jgi:hypothetical protein
VRSSITRPCVGTEAFVDTRLRRAATRCCDGTSLDRSSGVVELSNCATAAADGQAAPIGQDRPQSLFAFHPQAAGPFGTTIAGKYPP